LSVAISTLAIYNEVKNKTSGNKPRLSIVRKEKQMNTKDRTQTDSRDELIAKIMLSYKQLPPNRREAILSVLRTYAANKKRKG
jgi:hypothetical protein